MDTPSVTKQAESSKRSKGGAKRIRRFVLPLVLILLCIPPTSFALGFTFDPKAYYEVFGVDYSRFDATSTAAMHFACRLSGAALAGFVVLALSAGTQRHTFVLISALYIVVAVDAYYCVLEMERIKAPTGNIEAVRGTTRIYPALAAVALVCAKLSGRKDNVKSVGSSGVCMLCLVTLQSATALTVLFAFAVDIIYSKIGFDISKFDSYAELGTRDNVNTFALTMALIFGFLVVDSACRASFVGASVAWSLVVRALYKLVQELESLDSESKLYALKLLNLALYISATMVLVAALGGLTSKGHGKRYKAE